METTLLELILVVQCLVRFIGNLESRSMLSHSQKYVMRSLSFYHRGLERLDSGSFNFRR